ncbi:hypothetical protein A3C37_04090 [Candidatus Peribacteria bacterium RIFCSPHIGHO2_02_FULL_53_20]|nr:MAG: hypothetical protein A3C37_04090 [Candidatus Peribacteria bacterium RIFCSPHIGHO2_02_FULL_53_20]OGJ74725.1 MAG: hypothetical protein A3G69_04810 [Candidatus Peribacteria bacterium RIFCSPLOWO2_12_FULL_53_10]
MFRRFIVGLSLSTLLVGCGGSVSSTYRLQFDTEDPSRLTLLSLAVMRVVERRLQGMGEDVRGLDVSQKQGGPELSFSVVTEAAADLLREDLTAPFELRIMREAKEKETPTMEAEGHGGFVETQITQEHLEWIEAAEEPDNKGRITLEFTEEGRKLMRMIFRENVGKNIGLFVRGRLVAKLQVDTAELKDDIIITGIPSAELARVFADDVNVGLHVTFTPLP